MLSRRHFLQLASATTLTASLPRFAWGANSEEDNRLILVILRGGMDGLAALAPYDDPDYERIRAGLALPKPNQEGGVIDLDGSFGLNPAMAALYPLYENKQMACFHAIATPYRSRSHFDGQDVLENGATSAASYRNGWLGRALEAAAGSEAAIAISPELPLVLQGAPNGTVSSWFSKRFQAEVDSDFIQQVMEMYRHDTMLNPYFTQGIAAENLANHSMSEDEKRKGGRAANTRQFPQAAATCASFLKQPNGPRIAVLETAGWDTHSNQGANSGGLYRNLEALSQGLALLPDALGQDIWKKTVVLVATEFGRTAAENGTRGTDHGTASAAFMLGGSIHGRQVIADWPGLSPASLYEGRDVAPTTDIRSLFKTVLHEHMHISQSALNRHVFPDSGSVGLIRGLIKG
ncbi:MAG: DUF1501 domain-containing protein [Rickettsiales bacterium]